MQAYAWAGMLVSYSKDDGLLQAAKDTFSGEKPCELCCKIAEAKKADPAQEKKDLPLPTAPSGKLLQDFLPSEIVFLKPPRFTDFSSPSFPGFLMPVETSGASPPLPPPRSIA